MRHDIALLVLRIGFGGLMLFGHGWPKLMNFGTLSQTFPDPIGLGSSFSLLLAIFAEVFCSLAIMAGFMSRLAAIPLAVTMAVAAFVIHSADPWHKQEFALLYFIVFVAIGIAGAGSYSVDSVLGRNNRYS
jgi:putative oxidoreductase